MPAAPALADLRVAAVDALLQDELLRLRVLPAQRVFVGRIEDLLADAQSRSSCEPMAVLLGAQPIGFYCIERVARCIAPLDFAQPTLGLRGFFITAEWQGRGLGARALAALLVDLRQRHAATRALILSVDTSNASALALYRRAGFVDAGEHYHGGRAGGQQLLERALP